MENRPSRCPRCGKQKRGSTAHASGAAEGAGAVVITNNIECCTPPGSTSEELYAGIEPEIVMLSCCDPIKGCRDFDARLRNPFWPAFAHPRWLTCEQLYNRAARP